MASWTAQIRRNRLYKWLQVAALAPALINCAILVVGTPAMADSKLSAERGRPPTFRTMCVRVCDGYYWPMSFAATEDKFESDVKRCAASCASETKLFVTRNGGKPAVDTERMRGPDGQDYSTLPAAFKFREASSDACKCRPDPWEASEQERHLAYRMEAERANAERLTAAKSAAVEASAIAMLAAASKASETKPAGEVMLGRTRSTAAAGVRLRAPQPTAKITQSPRRPPPLARQTIAKRPTSYFVRLHLGGRAPLAIRVEPGLVPRRPRVGVVADRQSIPMN